MRGLQWDELQILLTFLNRNVELWQVHVEENGFEIPVANSIRARLAKMTHDELRAYVERFGEQPPALAYADMKVFRGEETYTIKLEKNEQDGWYAAKVPGKLAFCLMSKTLASMKERLKDNGWNWSFGLDQLLSPMDMKEIEEAMNVKPQQPPDL